MSDRIKELQIKRLQISLELKFSSILDWSEASFEYLEDELVNKNKLSRYEAEEIMDNFKKNNNAYTQVARVNNEKTLSIAKATWDKLKKKKKEEHEDAWQKLFQWIENCQMYQDFNKTKYTDEALKRFFVIIYCIERWDKEIQNG